ncbi:helix-turn-helix domain-containing protein [Elizabethkingia anophelis]|uniref:helix-turn-helix domain-containing protein n=1 Tax=Elizabethkingia anophelis TaxID=1117645 RepID=UPI00099AC52C|nr:helix-turn-helix transcriptional regulator [Elizabethkingia anophelis]MCT3719009.1 helix-turn-helix transcriptional regulator [Elizabethkingia anophelis]MCT3722519.1 helix-turn-helix transcriptional regulator [Elizabethkingia anophelis]MCT3754369.1 helix-turn-helix transcriptional regulator [Elizabethkingia anophelis]MCT3775166.1 helix-turn-helix transcriptional regulator [Elizabethkingia anophelis]MCT3782771.1 helix-turn-helix transcriptional regulator [Elizabethkingia anophelis]
MNIVGSRIKRIREEKGIKQEYMAYELDISQSNYGRLEKQDSRLTVPRIQKIARVLGVSVALLFGEETSNVVNEDYNGSNENAKHIESLKEEIDFLRKMLKEQGK